MSEAMVCALCQEFGIEIVPANVSPNPFQTRAVNTLKQISETRGEAHLRLVLTTLAETKAAQAPLEAHVIWAASDLVTACSEFIERDASAWLEMWDRLPLGWIMYAISHLRGETDQRRALAGAIYVELFRAAQQVGASRANGAKIYPSCPSGRPAGAIGGVTDLARTVRH